MMPELIPLFSTPIYINQISPIELDFSNVKWAKNFNNDISISQNILEDPIFSKLLPSISASISEYFYGIMSVSQQTEIFITESWLNRTSQGQIHHRHWHPNSIISGIIYLEGDENTGFTRFITSKYDQLEFEIIDANIYNSKSWCVQPIKNRIVLFPSSLEHLVDEYSGDNPRVTLSFNTFVKGKINTLPLTKLSY